MELCWRVGCLRGKTAKMYGELLLVVRTGRWRKADCSNWFLHARYKMCSFLQARKLHQVRSSCNGSHHLVMLLIIQCHSPGSSCLPHGGSRQGKWESDGNHHPSFLKFRMLALISEIPRTDVALLLIYFSKAGEVLVVFSWSSSLYWPTFED